MFDVRSLGLKMDAACLITAGPIQNLEEKPIKTSNPCSGSSKRGFKYQCHGHCGAGKSLEICSLEDKTAYKAGKGRFYGAVNPFPYRAL